MDERGTGNWRRVKGCGEEGGERVLIGGMGMRCNSISMQYIAALQGHDFRGGEGVCVGEKAELGARFAKEPEVKVRAEIGTESGVLDSGDEGVKHGRDQTCIQEVEQSRVIFAIYISAYMEDMREWVSTASLFCRVPYGTIGVEQRWCEKALAKGRGEFEINAEERSVIYMDNDLMSWGRVAHVRDQWREGFGGQSGRACLSADHMNAILGVYTDLDEVTNLQCDYLETLKKCEHLEKELSKSRTMSKSFEALQKHAINLELDLQQCKEKIKNDKSFNENKSNVFLKEREQYFEIQDMEAQFKTSCSSYNSSN
ncbi:hypothetical protein Tco_0751411 [Tanacetum coccineum]|uniref:Uncharacterized protein n=1 Tax=Tanacetum coccineum TaxID=301880 RepID=A0ABQ4Z448_9ASTR